LAILAMAMPVSSFSSHASGSGVKKNENIDKMLQRLGIEVHEFDDVIF
jgi:hypothetical protein